MMDLVHPRQADDRAGYQFHGLQCDSDLLPHLADRSGLKRFTGFDEATGRGPLPLIWRETASMQQHAVVREDGYQHQQRRAARCPRTGVLEWMVQVVTRARVIGSSMPVECTSRNVRPRRCATPNGRTIFYLAVALILE